MNAFTPAACSGFFVAEEGAAAGFMLVPGAVVSLLGGIVNTWILLIEILP